MKKYSWFIFLSMICVMLSACGSSYGKNEMAAAEDAVAEESYETESMEPPSAGTAENGQVKGEVFSSSEDNGVQAEQKLIRTAELSMETKEFDKLLEAIQTKTEELGGYVEASGISGNSYQSEEGKRYAFLTLRIPSERLNEFLTAAGDMGNVTNQSE